MKNSLMVPVVFIISYILCLIVVPVCASLSAYPVLNALVLGNYRLFSIALAYRVLYFSPVCLMLALLSVFFFLMRHPSIRFVSIPLVALCSFLAVWAIVPFSYQIMNRFSAGFAATEEYLRRESTSLQAPLSIRRDSGYLRSIWLAAEPDASAVTSLVTVNDAVRPGVPAMTVVPSAEFDEGSGSLVSGGTVLVSHAGGSHGLFEERLNAPSFVRSIGRDVSAVLDGFRLSTAEGSRAYYVLAGSFFAAICALWVFCHATGWRLLNVLLAATVFRLLFAAWPYTRSGIVPDALAKALPASIPDSLICPGLYLGGAALVTAVGLAVSVIRAVSRRNGGFHG